jgi:ATP-dependent Clp protease, protease subunit
MTEYIINIKGIIGYPEEGSEFNFSTDDIKSELKKAKKANADIIYLAINSEGGYINIMNEIVDEIDKFRVENPSIIFGSYNTGLVASAASILFLKGDADYRVFYEERGGFLIHNPWTLGIGESKDFLDLSIELRLIEGVMMDFYVKNTTATEEQLEAIMAINDFMEIELVEELGFARLVKDETEGKEKINNINNKYNIKVSLKQMNENELKISALKKTILGTIEKLFPKAEAEVQPVKNILIVDANGTEIKFPEVTEGEEVKVGDKAEVDGKPANGEFIKIDGTTIIIENGIVTEIVVPVIEEEEIVEPEVVEPVTEEMPVEQSAKAELTIEITEEGEGMEEVVEPVTEEEVIEPSIEEGITEESIQKMVEEMISSQVEGLNQRITELESLLQVETEAKVELENELVEMKKLSTKMNFSKPEPETVEKNQTTFSWKKKQK